MADYGPGRFETGQFIDRVQIQTSTPATNADGQVLPASWSTVLSVPARVRGVDVSEKNEQGRVQTFFGTEIVVRHTDALFAVGSNQRFLWRGKVLYPRSCSRHYERGYYLIFMCLDSPGNG